MRSGFLDKDARNRRRELVQIRRDTHNRKLRTAHDDIVSAYVLGFCVGAVMAFALSGAVFWLWTRGFAG